LTMIADSSVLTETIKTVLANHPGQVNDYRQGKTKVVGYLVGQIMRATQGRAKPDLVNQLLLTELDQSADRG
jgi:aspartyl-tRNA(Asn)/glutamyl-tRNA(Gln) amidotransferase subunit B